MNEKYSDQVTGDMLDIASPFDTRFRTMYMDKEKVEQVLSRAAEEIVSLIKAQQDTLSGAAGAAAEAEPFLLLRKKKKKTLASFFKRQSTIVTCHRAALKPDAVDHLVFLA